MELYKKPNPISEENTPIISVTVDINEESTDIWNNCISSEFPIINLDINENMAICQIGSPHHGYTLKASQKIGILDGVAFLYDYDNRFVASLTYQEGVANGMCRMYYRSGDIYFSGFLHEGYRNGPGVEYSKDGSPIYEGFYRNGRRAPNIKLRSDGSNYWDEKDENGKMVSLFQIDYNGLNHGICYMYCDGEISKISRWEHGKETELLKEFNGHKMKVFKNGEETFSGKYRKESDFEYVPIYKKKIKTGSLSIESKEDNKRDCECTYDCFEKIMRKIMIWIMGIILGLLSLALFILIAFSNWKYVFRTMEIIFCLYIHLLMIAGVFGLLLMFAKVFHECKCF